MSQHNVLYLAPWVTIGGSDKGTIDWFRELDRDRFRPFLVTTQESPNEWFGRAAAYADEAWSLPDVMAGSVIPAWLIDFVRSRQIDTLHVMNSRLGFDLLPALRQAEPDMSVVVQLHIEEQERAGYTGYAVRRYDGLIDAYSVISDMLAGIVAGYGASPTKVFVIPLGVDADEEWNPDLGDSVTPLPYPVPRTGYRVLFPARLVNQKDPFLMVAVARALAERGSQAVIDVVGDGPLRDELQAEVARSGLTARVVFHGVSTEMRRWYRGTDVVLMTSFDEGLPLVLGEALAMRLPVVASDVGACHELVTPDCGVLISRRGDADAYADALMALEGDPERRARLGQAGRAQVLSTFTADAMARAREDLYLRLADRSARV